MKLRIYQFFLLAILTVLTGLIQVNAQDNVNPDRARDVTRRLQDLSARLNLTDDQKEKIRPILIEEAPKLKALREDTSLSRRDKMTRMRAVLQETEGQIKPILTPEQIQQLEKMKKDGLRKARQSRRGT